MVLFLMYVISCFLLVSIGVMLVVNCEKVGSIVRFLCS